MALHKNRSLYIWALLLPFAMLWAAPSASAIGPVADEAKAPLASNFPGPLWEVVTPNGGAASVANAHLYLNVPGGSNHDALRGGNQAVRVVQPIGDVEFDVAIKIDSAMVATNADTSQGLMVVADDKDFITFALATDGTNISLSAHTITAGVAATVFEDAGFREYQNPMYLRVTRTGTAYKAYYSTDGVVWTQAGSFAFAKVPMLVGPFASNYNATPAKAVPVVMAINWFNIL
jgi:hypothetical protein